METDTHHVSVKEMCSARVLPRSPSSSPSFQNSLNASDKIRIIIVGDFNVRYSDNCDPHARALYDVLSDANLRHSFTDATRNGPCAL